MNIITLNQPSPCRAVWLPVLVRWVWLLLLGLLSFLARRLPVALRCWPVLWLPVACLLLPLLLGFLLLPCLLCLVLAVRGFPLAVLAFGLGLFVGCRRRVLCFSFVGLCPTLLIWLVLLQYLVRCNTPHFRIIAVNEWL